ncbi:MAG: hypothetical protein ACI4B3_03850 [Prevotella sp.]
MKLDSIIRTYGRDVMESLKGCHGGDDVKRVLAAAGFEASDSDVKDIAGLLDMLNGELRELSLDELSQITGG